MYDETSKMVGLGNLRRTHSCKESLLLNQMPNALNVYNVCIPSVAHLMCCGGLRLNSASSNQGLCISHFDSLCGACVSRLLTYIIACFKKCVFHRKGNL